MQTERDTKAPVMSRSFALATASFIVVLVCTAWSAPEARAQVAAAGAEEPPPPPHLKYIPAAERARLSEERDTKDRTRLALELAGQRLTRAAEHTTAERYEEAAGELAIYEALIEDGIRFLRNSGKPASKLRDLFKRVELALRSHMPRIETIRRSTPAQNAVHVKATLDYVRKARSEVLNAFYDDTVLPEASDQKEQSSRDEPHAKGSPAAAPGKEKKP
jgi:hypothetical protein